MNPSEKAKELVEKFKPYVDFWSNEINNENAKQCALICCEFTLEQLHTADTAYDLIPRIEFLNEIKEEIKKL